MLFGVGVSCPNTSPGHPRSKRWGHPSSNGREAMVAHLGFHDVIRAKVTRILLIRNGCRGMSCLGSNRRSNQILGNDLTFEARPLFAMIFQWKRYLKH